MTSAGWRDEERDFSATPSDRFQHDLIGLDPHDPEVRAFAEHLDRMERQPSRLTVEGYLAGVRDFAESANRSRGGWRLAAIVVVSLILLGAAVTVWDALVIMLSIIFG